MRNQNTNTNYSFEDIEKYLQGRLSPAEMHELEKAALQDPFLADAIEGYQSTNLSFAHEDLSSIRDQLLQGKQPIVKTINTAGKLNFVWQVAAACILITGAAVLSWYLLNNKSTPQETAQIIEMNNQHKKDSLLLLRTAMAKREAAELSTKRTSPAPVTDQEIQLKNSTATEREIDQSNQKKSMVASRSTISSMQKLDTVTNENRTATASLINQPLADRTAELQVNAAKESNASKDRVLVDGKTFFGDDDIKKQTDSAQLRRFEYTAANRFSPELAKSTSQNSLNETVSIGMGKKRSSSNTFTISDTLPVIPVNSSMVKRLSSSNPPVLVNNVIMFQSVEGEMAPYKLRGYNVKPASMPQAGDGFLLDTLAPDIGWVAYKDYLRGKLSETSFDKGKRTVSFTQFGTVELDITFDNKGRVSEVTVLKTFNPLLNDKLIKAILNGSAWFISIHDAKTKYLAMPSNKYFFRMNVTFAL
jgi:hypothetical protein